VAVALAALTALEVASYPALAYWIHNALVPGGDSDGSALRFRQLVEVLPGGAVFLAIAVATTRCKGIRGQVAFIAATTGLVGSNVGALLWSVIHYSVAMAAGAAAR
jgi:hypothetical protein